MEHTGTLDELARNLGIVLDRMKKKPARIETHVEEEEGWRKRVEQRLLAQEDSIQHLTYNVASLVNLLSNFFQVAHHQQEEVQTRTGASVANHQLTLSRSSLPDQVVHTTLPSQEEQANKKKQSVESNKGVTLQEETINADAQQQLSKVSQALAVLASASSINLDHSMMDKEGTVGEQDIMKAFEAAHEEIDDSTDGACSALTNRDYDGKVTSEELDSATSNLKDAMAKDKAAHVLHGDEDKDHFPPVFEQVSESNLEEEEEEDHFPPVVEDGDSSSRVVDEEEEEKEEDSPPVTQAAKSMNPFPTPEIAPDTQTSSGIQYTPGVLVDDEDEDYCPPVFEQEMGDLNRKRTRSTTGTGLNKYDLLRTTTTQEEEQPLVSQQNVKVRVRGSTNLFVDALEPLGPERRKMLEDTPFHKLLVMDRNIQNNVSIKNLATMFNTQDHSIQLKGERHVVTTQDVTEIMGIEDGEEEIKMPGRGQKTHVPIKLKKDFVKKGQKWICMEKVKTKLRESLDEDTVKRAYMLLALRYIIYPPSDRDYLPESCLDLVRDVNQKKRWATFVITSLVNGIEKYNNYKGNKEIFIGGCALFLQLYATKGSITTPKGNLPLECNKRRKKTRDKECSGSSSSETIESSLLKAMDTTRINYEDAMAYMRKSHKRMSSQFKNNESDNCVTQKNFETIFSMLESQRDTTIAIFQKSLDEHVAGVARRNCRLQT